LIQLDAEWLRLTLERQRTAMNGRSLLLAGLGAAALGAGLSGSQHESSERSIRLRFPDRADLTGLSIQYFLAGPFGGFGNFVRTTPDVREYALETWRNDQPGRTLKAIIYCPGYRIVLLTESLLHGRHREVVSVYLEPLRKVPLSGRLIWVPHGPDLTIEAVYLAKWGHQFFGIIDGPVASFTVATSKVAVDGTFELDIPDLARDPVVMSFGQGDLRGVLRLRARETKTGNIPYVLESVEQPGRFGLPVSEAYPRGLLLVAAP
jgi:hypothetical protein